MTECVVSTRLTRLRPLAASLDGIRSDSGESVYGVIHTLLSPFARAESDPRDLHCSSFTRVARTSFSLSTLLASSAGRAGTAASGAPFRRSFIEAIARTGKCGAPSTALPRSRSAEVLVPVPLGLLHGVRGHVSPDRPETGECCKSGP